MPNMSMPKTVVLVGHCGADGAYLKMTVKKALGDVHVVTVDDAQDFTRALETAEPDLILFNRELGYGFDPSMGVSVIGALHRTHPNLKMILVSNYQEAQRDAEAAGALPGFGKRELGTPRVLQVLREAVGVEAIK
jgi:two-component system chemotaxis response regulator CheY